MAPPSAPLSDRWLPFPVGFAHAASAPYPIAFAIGASLTYAVSFGLGRGRRLEPPSPPVLVAQGLPKRVSGAKITVAISIVHPVLQRRRDGFKNRWSSAYLSSLPGDVSHLHRLRPVALVLLGGVPAGGAPGVTAACLEDVPGHGKGQGERQEVPARVPP